MKKTKYAEYLELLLALSDLVTKTPELIELTKGKKVNKIIIVPGEVINFVTNEKKNN